MNEQQKLKNKQAYSSKSAKFFLLQSLIVFNAILPC